MARMGFRQNLIKFAGVAACAASARVTAILLLLAMLWPAPAPSQPPSSDSEVTRPADETIARRVAEARQNGYWVIAPGEHLSRICRYFHPEDRAQIERLRQYLIQRNGHSFLNGKSSLLVVGAKLYLPDDLLTPGPKLPPQQAAAPAKSFPASKPREPIAAAATAGTTITLPAAADTAPARSTAAPPEYQDRLIEGMSPEEPLESGDRKGEPSLGRKAVSLSYTYASRERSGGGTSRDQGLSMILSRETANHGDLRLEAQLSDFRPAATDMLPERRSVNATLYHTQFPLTATLTADSALGVVRVLNPNWLVNSYRVVLPSTLLAGATTRIASENSELRLSVGEPGRLAGIGVLDFERTEGRYTALTISSRLDTNWQVGGNLLSMRDSTTVADHVAATAAVEYTSATGGIRGKTQALANAGGRLGVWTDWEVIDRRLRQRLGAYHLDPGMLYGDSQPQNDVRGAYWRGEYRKGFDTYVAGVDGSQTNVRNDPFRPGQESLGAYGNFTLRIDRSTTVGAGLSVREEKPRQGIAEPRRVSLASSFVARQFDFGYSRLDGSISETRPEGSPRESIRTLNWNHDFPRWGALNTSINLSLTEESLSDRTVRRTVGGLALRGPLLGNSFWDTAVTYVDVNDGLLSERGYNAQLGVEWPFARFWNASLSWQRNTVQPSADNPLNPFRKDNTVQLGLRYDFAGGTPYARQVGAAGRKGSGRISGSVFFDENGDGIRQPNERGVEGIVVILDGRYPVSTTRDGSFVFPQIVTGSHNISILLEKVPLPWGLADEAPRQLRVELREESRVDIGLTRISP